MKTLKQKRSILTVLVTLLILAVMLPGVATLDRASAATKRIVVSERLLTNNGRLNIGDWQNVGMDDAMTITDNGTLLQINNPVWPGVRLLTYNAVPTGKGFVMEWDAIKTDAATSMIDLSGFGTINGGKSYLYVSGLGVTPYLGAAGQVEGDKILVDPDTKEERQDDFYYTQGYRYRFSLLPGSTDTVGSAMFERAVINADGTYGGFTDRALIEDFLVRDIQDEVRAQMYIQGHTSIDNLKVSDEDGNILGESNFDDRSKFNSTGDILQDGFLLAGNAAIVNDTYLTISSPDASDRLVSYVRTRVDDNLEKSFDLAANIRFDSLSGKAGFIFGMQDTKDAIDADGVSFVYFQNSGDPATTSVGIIKNGQAGTPVNLGVNLADEAFHSIKITGNDGGIEVNIEGELKATFAEQNLAGYVGIATDGTNNTGFSFLPSLIIDTYEYQKGEGPDLANNFNTGYINLDHYIVDGHPAPTLGDRGKGIEVVDGKVLFNGTSDGSHFALTGTYADFILQFDWINFAWEDRPAKADGTVNNVPKPDNGRATELYSSLGIAFGKADPVAGWADRKLLRFFDSLNLVQFLNMDEGGNAYNITMGSGFATAEQCADIQPGKIDLYENTVNIKIVALAGELKVYGVVMKDGEPQGEHLLIAEFEYENAFGSISFSTSEAAYFAIDNLRITKIDGMDSEPQDYQNFIEIEDQQIPILSTPQVTVSGNVVSWDAVAGAKEYQVIIDDAEPIAVTDTTYTLTADAGEYTVKIKAVGDGMSYIDSAESASVTVTIPEEEEPSPTDTQTPPPKKDPNGCGGCSGAVPGGMIAAAAVLLVLCAIIISKRDKRKS